MTGPEDVQISHQMGAELIALSFHIMEFTKNMRHESVVQVTNRHIPTLDAASSLAWSPITMQRIEVNHIPLQCQKKGTKVMINPTNDKAENAALGGYAIPQLPTAQI